MQRAGNRRYYRPADVELAHRIHRLLNEEGYTVRGVQKLLRDKSAATPKLRSAAIDGHGRAGGRPSTQRRSTSTGCSRCATASPTRSPASQRSAGSGRRDPRPRGPRRTSSRARGSPRPPSETGDDARAAMPSSRARSATSRSSPGLWPTISSDATSSGVARMWSSKDRSRREIQLLRSNSNRQCAIGLRPRRRAFRGLAARCSPARRSKLKPRALNVWPTRRACLPSARARAAARNRRPTGQSRSSPSAWRRIVRRFHSNELQQLRRAALVAQDRFRDPRNARCVERHAADRHARRERP